MKITRDVPGERLTLERDAPRIPPGAPALVLLVVSLPFLGATVWAFPAAFAPGADPGQKIAAFVMTVFWIGLFFSTARAVRRRARWPTAVDADRASGELRLRESGLFGGVAPEAIIPLARLDGLTVRRTSKAPSLHDPRRPVKAAPGVALTFRIRREGASDAFESREVAFRVRHLDRPEEVADLALRLGAAAGLPFFRIVRSDARDVEVALRRDFETGFGEVPSALGPADYARDVVAAPARSMVETEKVPPFEPQAFVGDHRVAVWNPGSEVRFRKPLSFAAVGCLPFTLLVFTGPASFFFIHAVGATGGGETLQRLVVAAFLGVFGLIFGAIAIVGVASALPRTALVDWTSRSIQVRTLTKRRLIPFEAVRAVEMKALHHVSSGKSTRHHYWCEVGLHLRGQESGALTYDPLVATERARDDPDTPYKTALPLATELAKALGVARRISDYS